MPQIDASSKDTERFDPSIQRPLPPYENKRYWKIHYDKSGRPCIGYLYPGHDYRDASIMSITVYSKIHFLRAFPITECRNNIFGFVNDVKCLYCKKSMKVYFEFIDDKTSYMFDVQKTCGKVCVRIKNSNVALAHSTCLAEEETKKNHSVLFAIKERRMLFLKYWLREILEKESLKDTLMIVPVVISIITILLTLAAMLVYAIISLFIDLNIEYHIELNNIVIILMLSLCIYIYMRKLYLDDLYENGQGMILELREIYEKKNDMLSSLQ